MLEVQGALCYSVCRDNTQVRGWWTKIEFPEKGLPLLLVDAGVLPEVFGKVLEAKEHLQSGRAATAAEAARMAGISRSAFYKYKDAVFPYDAERSGSILTLHLILRDRPGVLSSVLSSFAAAGVNILTVNQNIPAGGVASVSISARDRPAGTAGEGFYSVRPGAAGRGTDRPDYRRRPRWGGGPRQKIKTLARRNGC